MIYYAVCGGGLALIITVIVRGMSINARLNATPDYEGDTQGPSYSGYGRDTDEPRYKGMPPPPFFVLFTIDDFDLPLFLIVANQSINTDLPMVGGLSLRYV